MTGSVQTIRDISIGVYDGPHATPELHKEGAAVFLGISNIHPNGWIDLSSARWVDERDLQKWNRRVTPQANDIVFTYEATLNRYAIIPDGLRCTLGRRTALIRPDSEKIDHRFLFYYFFSPRWRAQIEANTLTGATVDRIPLTNFPDFEVFVPTLDEQRRIADVLSNYDALIAINQRRIALLEEAGRRLYREWFVHLRFPGNETAKVLGGVPEGWRREPIGALFDYYIGGGWGKEESDGSATEAAYVIRGTDIPRLHQGATSTVPLRYHPPTNLASRRLKAGDLVFEVSGGSRDQGVGRLLPITAQLLEQFDRPVMCASFCKLIRPVNCTSEYVALTLSHLRESEGLRSFESQSASNIVNFAFTEFCNKQIVYHPPRQVLRAFQDVIEPFWMQMANLGQQQVALAQARDALLPKLMSGQIDAPSNNGQDIPQAA